MTTAKATGRPISAEGKSSSGSSIRDAREGVETVVFVLVLVNLLRIFGAEAFVIPTGSMATTLLGAHKQVVCPECGCRNCVNASEEAERGPRYKVEQTVCQNCRKHLTIPPPTGLQATMQRKLPMFFSPISGGDRVLVAKFLYEGFEDPQRWQVVVFKCPERMKGKDNFIKRLIGRPNETIRIRGGDIYAKPTGATTSLEIQSKPPAVVQAVKRLVYDNDLQAKDLVEAGAPRRWQPDKQGSWSIAEEGKSFTPHGAEPAWLSYQHLLCRDVARDGGAAQLITDFESYNAGVEPSDQPANWVGDLLLECTAAVRSKSGFLTLQLIEGQSTYDCVFDLTDRKIRLKRNGELIGSCDSPVQKGSSWNLSFANFDDQLIVWVEGKLVYVKSLADGRTQNADEPIGPYPDDLRPARIGSTGAEATFSAIKLYRDVYYTLTARGPDARIPYPDPDPLNSLPLWRRELADGLDYRGRAAEFNVGPDQFFMLGDNSPCSSDGREWTLTNYVDRDLLLGRAIFLYWPMTHWEFVR